MQKHARSLDFVQSSEKFIWVFALAWLLAGCERASPPIMYGPKYGKVLFNENLALHQGGNLRLFKYSANKKPQLIWTYVGVGDPGVSGDLIVFSGGLSDDRTWKYYPALLGYSGTGKVVELTKPLVRRMAVQTSGATNYSLEVTAMSNGVINLRASQRPPIDRTKPISLSLDSTENEIHQLINNAQTNGLPKKYDGVSYFISQ